VPHPDRSPKLDIAKTVSHPGPPGLEQFLRTGSVHGGLEGGLLLTLVYLY
jgi:hypothetical protein